MKTVLENINDSLFAKFNESKLTKEQASLIKGGMIPPQDTGAGEGCGADGNCYAWDADTTSGVYFNLRVIEKLC